MKLSDIFESESQKINPYDTLMAIIEGKGKINEYETQLSSLRKEGNLELFYVATYYPSGSSNADIDSKKWVPFSDLEGYLVYNHTDHKASFYDNGESKELWVDGKFIHVDRNLIDDIDSFVDEYKLESGKALPGAIEAYEDLLKAAADRW